MSRISDAKVFATTYRKYNEGSGDGEWVDLDEFDSEEDFYEHLAELHSDEDEPEYMFTDYENIPSGLVSESGLSDNFWILKDNENSGLIAEWAYHIGIDIDEAIDNFDEYYQGDDIDTIVEEIVDTYNLPEFAKIYFDYEAFKRDLLIGDYTEVEYDGDTYYFRNY